MTNNIVDALSVSLLRETQKGKADGRLRLKLAQATQRQIPSKVAKRGVFLVHSSAVGLMEVFRSKIEFMGGDPLGVRTQMAPIYNVMIHQVAHIYPCPATRINTMRIVG